MELIVYPLLYERWRSRSLVHDEHVDIEHEHQVG
jgi:hypothetical protein